MATRDYTYICGLENTKSVFDIEITYVQLSLVHNMLQDCITRDFG